MSAWEADDKLSSKKYDDMIVGICIRGFGGKEMKKRNLAAMTMTAMMIMANVSPAMLTAMADVETQDSTVNQTEDNVGGTAEQTGESAETEAKETRREPVIRPDSTGSDEKIINANIDVEGSGTAVDAAAEKAVSVEGKYSLTINGNVSVHDAYESTGISVEDGGTVKVTGNVSAEGKHVYGISTYNSGSVDVDGDVSAEGEYATGLYAGTSATDGKSTATVHVTGKVTANGNGSNGRGIGVKVAGNGSYIAVDQDIISDGSGIVAYSGTQVNVGGNIKAGSGSAIFLSGEGDVTVHGNVSGSRGVIVDGVSYEANEDEKDQETEFLLNTEKSASVVIDGSLHADENQAIILFGSDAKVIVKGDVSSAQGSSVKIGTAYNYGNADEKGNSEIAIGGTLKNKDDGAVLAVEIDKEGNALETPEIVIGTVEDINKLNVSGYYYEYSNAANGDGAAEIAPEISEEAKQKVLSSIRYIVNTRDIENGTLTVTKLDGSRLERDRADRYDVAAANDEIKVQIVPVSGYSVKNVSGGRATVTKNSDGSFTVLVPAGGGVDISAILEKIEEQTETPADTKKETETTTVSVKKSSSGGGSGYSAGSLHAVRVTSGAGRTALPNTSGSWQQNADKSWSFMDSDGAICRSTWVVSNSRWYYMDASGKAVTGWVEINGVWYYFTIAESSTNPLGSMLAGTTTPDGYTLDGNGAWVR